MMTLFNRYSPPQQINPLLPTLQEIQDDLAQEKQMGLKPDNQKEVYYHGAEGEKSKYSIVFLHGFSASPKELAPYPKNLAKELGANGYSTRFKGHGTMLSSALADATLADWQKDALIALSWGLELGEKVILAANSTGCTFALWLAVNFPDKIHDLILTSPNMGPKSSLPDLLLYPGGKLLTKMLTQIERKCTQFHPKQMLYWHTKYPSQALTTMMHAVEMARHLPLARIKIPALVLYSKQDKTVNLDAVKEMFHLLGSKQKKMVHIQAATGHLLGGVVSAQSDPDLMEIAFNFIRSNFDQA
ncbi:MAG: alpha/beta fold hydrolase [Bdellovibrionales bacterium]|jgi:esterase/lipase|nr:alpha/beta fold hydrolase [Bdellovibrionales bacterium]MBT3525643.1 alpha/beta fold hydrolase [Bdellovibrionales bacterium]MBT7669355.1 alpha/beta fold hydrolase [Bdellovibrionales bacterium]MBT7766321.1 alpha/beta fold hydrolase [Bdellovibrionales bacterium]